MDLLLAPRANRDPETVKTKLARLHEPHIAQTREVRYTFDELAAVVPGGLPPSGYRYEAWWSKGDRTHPQSRSWGDAGYNAHPDISRRLVRFIPRQRQ